MEIARTLYPPLLVEFKFLSSDFADIYKRGGKIDLQKLKDVNFAALNQVTWI